MSDNGAILNAQEYYKRKQEQLAQATITPWKACIECGLALNMKVPICPRCEKNQYE